MNYHIKRKKNTYNTFTSEPLLLWTTENFVMHYWSQVKRSVM